MSRAAILASNKALADAVGEGLEGQRLASHFLARLRLEPIDTDDLERALKQANAASPARLRGFCRRIQRALEQGADHA